MSMRRHIPNAITLLRVGFAPIIVFSFFLGTNTISLADGTTLSSGLGILSPFTARIITLALIIFAELTDAFDGFAARKMNLVSEVGKVLDPFADSIYRLTIFTTFVALRYIPFWMLLIFIYRDSLASFVRILSARKGTMMAARISGKIKAIVQATGMFVVLAVDLVRFNPFHPIAPTPLFHSIMFYTFLAVAAYTFYSGIDYLVGSYTLWKEVPEKG